MLATLAIASHRSTSLGLQPVWLLTQQLDGSVTVTSDRCSRFTAELAAPEG